MQLQFEERVSKNQARVAPLELNEKFECFYPRCVPTERVEELPITDFLTQRYYKIYAGAQ